MADSDRDLAAEALRSGDLAATQSAHATAVGHYRDATRLMPNLAEAYYKLGCALERCGNLDEAIRSLDEYIELQPQDPNGCLCRGMARHRIGQQLLAVADYSQTIAIKPDYARAFYLRGCAYNDLGNTEKAIRDFGDAIRDARDRQLRYDALYRRATCLSRLNRHQDAIEDLRGCTEMMPDSVSSWLALALEYGRMGRTDDGLAAAEKALRLAPDNYSAHFFRGNLLVRHGDLDAALTEYTIAVQLNADDAEAYCGLARAHLKMGRVAEAEADYARALDLGFRPPRTEGFGEAPE
jgi:tetratricopeptide (TPR) repeat protein